MNTYDDMTETTALEEVDADLRQTAHEAAVQLVNETFPSLTEVRPETRDLARQGYKIEADGSIVVSDDEQQAQQMIAIRGAAEAKPPATGGDANSIHGAIKDISGKGVDLSGKMQREEKPNDIRPIVTKGPVNSNGGAVKEK